MRSRLSCCSRHLQPGHTRSPEAAPGSSPRTSAATRRILLTLSTTGNGTFDADISKDGTEITYRLSYAGLEGNVTQAHIHLGQAAQSGGISAFLCTNLGNGPAGTQLCPAAPATITGTIRAADVIGPAGQGITAGQLNELVRAMNAGATYANVHTTLYPGGEIRAKLDNDKSDD